MTDHITIPRALLEQALEALDVAEDALDVALDAAFVALVDAAEADEAELEPVTKGLGKGRHEGRGCAHGFLEVLRVENWR